jgi:hypothetical protein
MMSDSLTLQELNQALRNSEKRLEDKLNQTKKEIILEIRETEHKIYKGIGDLIDEGVFKQLDEKADKKDLDKLTKRVTVIEQNSSI